MRAFLPLSRAIDALTAFIGRWSSWLILAAIFVSAGNAIIRKAFDMSSNAWLELQWLLFGITFLVAAPYTLQRNEHIRIDIISSMLSKRLRNWIDLFGHLFMLVPFALLMIVESARWAWGSYLADEHSSNFGGLPLWPAKIVIVVGFTLLLMQAVSEIIKRLAIMEGLIVDEHEPKGHLPPILAEIEDLTPGGKA